MSCDYSDFTDSPTILVERSGDSFPYLKVGIFLSLNIGFPLHTSWLNHAKLNNFSPVDPLWRETKIGKFGVVLSMPKLLASCIQMISYEATYGPVIRMAVENAQPKAIIMLWRDILKMLPRRCSQRQKVRRRCCAVRGSTVVCGQSPNLKSRTLASIRKYEQAAQSNIKNMLPLNVERRTKLRIMTSGTIVREQCGVFEQHLAALPISLPLSLYPIFFPFT